MRKTAVLLMMIFSGLQAQNIMKIDSLQIALKDTGSMSIIIENTDGFVGFQCDLHLPVSLTLVDMDLTERAVDHNLTLIDKGAHIYRILVYSITNTAFNGHDGEVLTFDIAADSLSGNYPVLLDSAIMGNASAENILTGTEQGYVEIIDTTVTGIDRGNYIPSEHDIKIHNYPNPCNSSTVINYELLCASIIDVSIFSFSGKKVESLFRGLQYAGIHEYRWNAEDQPSGIYIARIQAHEKVATRKILLLK